ncbi:Hypothetical predicted protein, partial [Podarcis lilfordi]
KDCEDCEERFRRGRKKIKCALSPSPPPCPPHSPCGPLFEKTRKAPRTSLPPQAKEKGSHPEEELIIEDIEDLEEE